MRSGAPKVFTSCSSGEGLPQRGAEQKEPGGDRMEVMGQRRWDGSDGMKAMGWRRWDGGVGTEVMGQR